MQGKKGQKRRRLTKKKSDPAYAHAGADEKPQEVGIESLPEKQIDLNMPLVPPIVMVKRGKGARGVKGAYLMQRGPHPYVCGISEKQSAQYEKLLGQVLALIEAGEIKTPAEARDWIARSK